MDVIIMMPAEALLWWAGWACQYKKESTFILESQRRTFNYLRAHGATLLVVPHRAPRELAKTRRSHGLLVRPVFACVHACRVPLPLLPSPPHLWHTLAPNCGCWERQINARNVYTCSYTKVRVGKLVFEIECQERAIDGPSMCPCPSAGLVAVAAYIPPLRRHSR